MDALITCVRFPIGPLAVLLTTAFWLRASFSRLSRPRAAVGGPAGLVRGRPEGGLPHQRAGARGRRLRGAPGLLPDRLPAADPRVVRARGELGRPGAGSVPLRESIMPLLDHFHPPIS